MIPIKAKEFSLLCLVLCFAQFSAVAEPFRPPAIPLVAVDPYFSIWSFANHLTYDSTRHWTGKPMVMESMVRIDGKAYRIMGSAPSTVTPAQQVSVRVFPTRTTYTFRAGPIVIRLGFLTPDLPHHLHVLARPVTYLTWTAQSFDGKSHDVALFYDNNASFVINEPSEAVVWSRHGAGTLSVLRMGTARQAILAKAGDRVKIDWGYVYVAAEKEPGLQEVAANQKLVQDSFSQRGTLPRLDDLRMPRAANEGWPSLAVAWNLGEVGAQPVSRHLILAYDEIYPIEYFHVRLRPYWEGGGVRVDRMLQNAARDYEGLRAECERFDQELSGELARAGGPEYALVTSLAYRQAFAANKLALSPTGNLLMFLKEISSCGCAQTVDVIYPESPFLLLLNPHLLEDSLVPLLDYARSGKWPYPFAPHDLGTYPLDNGRIPSRMENMPVEESGNMLLMVAGIAKAEGDASFARRYWSLLSQWARYLNNQGLDPGNQLCTDDFTGLLAHNANLSLKAIEALGGYAMLAKMLGDRQVATSYWNTAQDYARKWTRMANDGDHTRLAFDRPGTWSQKYNLVWDRVLGLNLFAPEVAQREVSWYEKQNTYFGFPLDSRLAYTKLDWESWCATLAPSNAVFRALFTGLYNFANQTPTRVPLSDWSWTTDGTQVGFQARPVVGALYMKLLADAAVWKKWASGRE
jgi:Domain of unknown function (DUF4965)/Domain of unknown function (DUF5127)/Domain of unknown function (DUF1793)/Domain of unknown function (DUF4964)